MFVGMRFIVLHPIETAILLIMQPNQVCCLHQVIAQVFVAGA